MALVLNEEQEMLREAASGFISESAPVAALRKLRDEEDETGFSRDLWSEMAQMGWAGIIVPEDHGGSEFGYVGAGLIAEEMGKNLTASPFLATSIMVATALNRLGSDAQKQALLPKIADGSLVMALAIDERRKHRPSTITTKAEKSGNGFRLSGSKTFVADGHVADQMVVAARTSGDDDDRDGVSLFLVDAKTDGVATERTMMVDSRNAARIQFDGVQLSGDAVLGEVDDGRDGLNAILNAGRAGLSAEMLGAASQAFDITLDYIRERKQFGKEIGSFQALQHRASHLYTELEMARAITLQALQALDDDAPMAELAVSMAKAKVGRVATLAAQEGIQMHGGMGMTDAFDIGLYIKRIRVAQEMLGDVNYHSDAIGQALGY
ncbi:MAG: acyl-CoA dehydrogenase [Pseudomonadota bacterium]